MKTPMSENEVYGDAEHLPVLSNWTRVSIARRDWSYSGRPRVSDFHRSKKFVRAATVRYLDRAQRHFQYSHLSADLQSQYENHEVCPTCLDDEKVCWRVDGKEPQVEVLG